MKKSTILFTILISAVMVNLSASGYPDGPSASVKEELVTYSANGVTLKGVIAYDSNIKGKRPAIIVVPEWWGLTDYAKMRAHMLAELGYVAMAADMFGEGRIAADPKEAQALTGPFYQDPQLAKSRLEAAIARVKQFSDTDPSRIAAIGYCFGGFVVLNAAKLGSDLKGVVSFHGGLTGVPVKKDLLKASILVCHGGADKFVSMNDYNLLKHQLDSIGADNTFRIYPGATHAFTNPDATQNGKKFNMPIEYNEKADKDSWNDMKEFLARIFKK
jgi:dienelactone hydrolase